MSKRRLPFTVPLVLMLAILACGNEAVERASTEESGFTTQPPESYAVPTLPASWTPNPSPVSIPTATSTPSATPNPNICASADLESLQEPIYAISVDVFASASAIDFMGECHRESLGSTTSLLMPPSDIQETINIIQGSIANSGAIVVLPCAKANRVAAIEYHQVALSIAQAVQRCDSFDNDRVALSEAADRYAETINELRQQVPGIVTVFDGLESIE